MLKKYQAAEKVMPYNLSGNMTYRKNSNNSGSNNSSNSQTPRHIKEDSLNGIFALYYLSFYFSFLF